MALEASLLELQSMLVRHTCNSFASNRYMLLAIVAEKTYCVAIVTLQANWV